MTVSPGWMGSLLRAARETGAAMVSPIIVTQGGAIHFSAGFVKRRILGVVRPHFQKGGPVGTNVQNAKLERVDIDFAESHSCLAETAAMRLPGVLNERMHNAQTLCYAAYKLKTQHNRRIVIEPTATTSIVPISFGYDIAWMCRSYMNPALIEGSYHELRALMGRGPGTNLKTSLRWHQKHFMYLLATLPLAGRLETQELLDPAEVPENILGYDYPLKKSTDSDITTHVLPWVQKSHPELLPHLEPWIGSLFLDRK